MAELKAIKALFEAMTKNGIDEFSLESAEEKLSIRRRSKKQETPIAPHE